MNNPVVSILMPAYNAMPLIKASVQSVLNQTFKDWECIIVDDGSTDGTSAFLDTLSALDSRFVIHHFGHNQGRPKARQKTLELARGKYIAMLDAEDLMAPNRLEIQVDALEKHPELSLVSSCMCSFGTSCEIRTVRGATKFEIFDYDGKSFPNHAASMLYAEEARKIRYNKSMKLGEDADFLKRYLIGRKYAKMPEVLYYYSEFDSVSKEKIQRTYIHNLKKAYTERNTAALCRAALQYIYTIFVFPFISTESIIKKRGRALSDEQAKQFQTDCLSIVNKVLKEM